MTERCGRTLDDEARLEVKGEDPDSQGRVEPRLHRDGASVDWDTALVREVLRGLKVVLTSQDAAAVVELLKPLRPARATSWRQGDEVTETRRHEGKVVTGVAGDSYLARRQYRRRLAFRCFGHGPVLRTDQTAGSEAACLRYSCMGACRSRGGAA